MAQYAIAFDLDTTLMDKDGLQKADKTRIYQTEIPHALQRCGFTEHLQGSLYATSADQNPITAILQLQSTLKACAPNFCKYVKRVHVFRLEDWSDVTTVISDHPAAGLPTAEEELEEEELAGAQSQE